MCAILSGADEWRAIEAYGKAKRTGLETFLALPNGIPSHDPFGRVFTALDPDQFEACFLAWGQTTVSLTEGVVIAREGKTVRRSHDAGAGKAAVHMVSAWASAQHLVLGQRAVDEKSDDAAQRAPTAIPALLVVLMLTGCSMTIDAMGRPKEIAETIVEQDADALARKANHACVYHDVVLVFADAAETSFVDYAADMARTVDSGHSGWKAGGIGRSRPRDAGVG